MRTRRFSTLSAGVLAICMALGRSALATTTTIRPVPGAWVFGPRAVWTLSTSTAVFHPLSEPMPALGLINIRVTTEMNESTGNCKVRPALRWSSDGVAWDNSAYIVSAYVTSPGVSAVSSWIDVNSLGTPKPWVQFGVEAANNDPAVIELCNATIMIEPKERM